MKRFVRASALSAVVLVLCGTASAASPSPVAKQIAALQKTVKAQGNTINALRSQVNALNSKVAGFAGQISSANSSVGELAGTVQTNTNNLTTLNNNVTSLTNNYNCRVAQFFTLDDSLIDFDLIEAGQPEQFVGQTFPDNGGCAASGLTPPSPASTTMQRPTTLTPLQQQLLDMAIYLGAIKP